MNKNIPFTAPTYHSKAFDCPHCHAYAKQRWGDPPKYIDGCNYGQDEDLSICRCDQCEGYSIWVNKNIIYRMALTSPDPNNDLPDDIKADYEEARRIASLSPRGAAALLRLSIQKICKHLGEPGNNINNDILA